jgi:hypothetical protein
LKREYIQNSFSRPGQIPYKLIPLFFFDDAFGESSREARFVVAFLED